MSVKQKKILYIIAAIFVLSVIFLLYRYRIKVSKITTPLIFAIAISYLITPWVIKLESKNIPRKIGILLIYLAFLIVFTGVILFIIPEVVENTEELMNTIPDMANKYQNIFNRIISSVESSNWPKEIKNALYNEIENGLLVVQTYVTNILKKILSSLVSIASIIFNLVLAMVIGYYLVKDSEVFRSSVLSLVPRKWRKGFCGIASDIGDVLSNFIQGQLTTALIVGVLESIGLILLKIRYPFLLGMLGGLANMIPYFGPVIGSVPATAVALIDSPIKAIWTILMFVIVQQLDNTLISPKIIQGRLGLHPVTTIIAVIAGREFFGIPGMLLSVPITAMLKVILKRIVNALA
jgi:predicted PurR-regulated permease PerM